MTKRNERKIALNYIYLSKHHSGGKDQVGLNLLKGLQEMGVTKQMAVICYPFSVGTVVPAGLVSTGGCQTVSCS